MSWDSDPIVSAVSKNNSLGYKTQTYIFSNKTINPHEKNSVQAQTSLFGGEIFLRLCEGRDGGFCVFSISNSACHCVQHTALYPLTKGNAGHHNITLSKNDDCRGRREREDYWYHCSPTMPAFCKSTHPKRLSKKTALWRYNSQTIQSTH